MKVSKFNSVRKIDKEDKNKNFIGTPVLWSTNTARGFFWRNKKKENLQ